MGITTSTKEKSGTKYSPASQLEARICKAMQSMRDEKKDDGKKKQKKSAKAVFTGMQLKFPKYKASFDSVRTLYDRLDTHKTGSLDLGELEVALKDMGATIDKDGVATIFEGVDVNHDKSLSFKEFMVCIALGYLLDIIPPVKGKDLLKNTFEAAVKMFKIFDDNHDGVIETGELHTALKDLQLDTADLMKELDPDKDGYVTFIEFLFAFESWVGVEDEVEEEKTNEVVVETKDEAKASAQLASQNGNPNQGGSEDGGSKEDGVRFS